VPPAFVSKSSKGIAAARSCDGCAAAWTMAVGRTLEAPLIPSRVAGRAEKRCALIVVEAVHVVALPGEVRAHLAADQARRSGDEKHPAYSHEPIF
jgi:hypothetical protein